MNFADQRESERVVRVTVPQYGNSKVPDARQVCAECEQPPLMGERWWGRQQAASVGDRLEKALKFTLFDLPVREDSEPFRGVDLRDTERGRGEEVGALHARQPRALRRAREFGVPFGGSAGGVVWS